MRLWGYYAFHTFINSIRKMFRSTFIIVMAAILGIGFLAGLAAGVLVDVAEGEYSSEEDDETLREGYGDPEYGYFDENGTFLFYVDLCEAGLGGYDENGAFVYFEDAFDQNLGYYDADGEFIFYYEEMTEEEIAQMLLVAEAAAFILVLCLIGFGIYSGRKKGSDIFQMADVNFLFTAPMKPQSVLMFRLTFQMAAVVTGSIYFLYQIPNLVLNGDVPLKTCLIIYVALLIAFVFQKLFSVGTYTITATHPKMRKWVIPLLLGVGLLVVLGAVSAYFLCGTDIWSALEGSYAAKWTRLIPIVGWIKGMVIHAIYGNMLMVFIYLLLNLAGMAGLVCVIWHMKADFYEDAMAGAQARADLLVAAKESGKTVVISTDEKKKEKRKVSQVQAHPLGTAQGAAAFFAKERIVRHRMAKFGLITNTMLWYLVICAGMAVLNVKVLDVTEFTITGLILMAVLFFRNYGNPIAQETSMNWLFLVPENPYKKVFFAMMAGSYATAVDMLPGMLAAMCIMQAHPVDMLLWYATLITMDFMLSAVGMMLEALFPVNDLDVVKAMIQMILKFAALFVVVIPIVIGVVLGGFSLGLILAVIANALVGGICFVIYPSKLHGGI